MTLHCWQSHLETLKPGSEAWVKAMDEMTKTCMLPAGHEGPHEWTDDDKITIAIAAHF